MKKLDEIDFKETADKIAKSSEEFIKEGSSTSISFLKRTKEALASQIAQVAQNTNQRGGLKDKAAQIGGKLWGLFGAQNTPKKEEEKEPK